MSDFKVGDRVYIKPYRCTSMITLIEWDEGLNLGNGRFINPGYIYWVKLDHKDLKPRGFTSKSLKIIQSVGE